MNREIFRKMVLCAVSSRYVDLKLSTIHNITTMVVSNYDIILSDDNFTIDINYSDNKTSITIRDRYEDNNIVCLLDIAIHLREKEIITYFCDTVIENNTIVEKKENIRRCFVLEDF